MKLHVCFLCSALPASLLLVTYTFEIHSVFLQGLRFYIFFYLYIDKNRAASLPYIVGTNLLCTIGKTMFCVLNVHYLHNNLSTRAYWRFEDIYDLKWFIAQSK